MLGARAHVSHVQLDTGIWEEPGDEARSGLGTEGRFHHVVESIAGRFIIIS